MPNCKCCGKPVTGGVVLHSECYDLCVMGSADGGRQVAAPTGWIPVTERLPEEDGRYIVTVCDEGCSCGDGIWYDTVVVEAEYYKGEWSWNGNGTEYDVTGLVTHWMPLPQPPKGE